MRMGTRKIVKLQRGERKWLFFVDEIRGFGTRNASFPFWYDYGTHGSFVPLLVFLPHELNLLSFLFPIFSLRYILFHGMTGKSPLYYSDISYKLLIFPGILLKYVIA